MNITVYCGSNSGINSNFVVIANQLSDWIISNKYNMIYGGANIGLMKTMADNVLNGGCKVYGVMTKELVSREITHNGLSKLDIVDNMHQRKMKMIEDGDVYIALPGGPGTLEEIVEVISWKRIGIHNKPCIIVNVDGFYDELHTLFLKMLNNSFITSQEYSQVSFITNISELNNIIERKQNNE